jgi:hypothetical protein
LPLLKFQPSYITNLGVIFMDLSVNRDYFA